MMKMKRNNILDYIRRCKTIYDVEERIKEILVFTIAHLDLDGDEEYDDKKYLAKIEELSDSGLDNGDITLLKYDLDIITMYEDYNDDISNYVSFQLENPLEKLRYIMESDPLIRKTESKIELTKVVIKDIIKTIAFAIKLQMEGYEPYCDD